MELELQQYIVYWRVYMSPKKKKKLKHQTHEGESYTSHRVSNSNRRGIKKFIIGTIDVDNTLDWESTNYEEVYN